MYKSTPPDRPPVPPLGAFQKDMLFIADTLCLLLRYIAGTDSVMSMLRVAIEKSRALAFSSTPPRADGGPVEYEYRACPHWDDRWTEWRSCPKEIAEEYRQCPDVHGWRYEIREVPQIRPLSELLDQIAANIRDQGKTWPLAAYEESALIVESYKEATPGYLPCAEQCGNAVPVGGDPVCHLCRSEHASGAEGEQA